MPRDGAAAEKSYNRPLTIYGFVWALPNTLVGLLLALLSLARPRFRGGMLFATGDRALAHLFLTRRGFQAMTLGRALLATRPLTMGTWMHEVEHARQAERWGLLYIPAYLVRHLRHGYWNNPFEAGARLVEEEFRDDHPDQAERLLPF